MKKGWKKSIHKLLSYVLTMAMMCSMMPMSAFAADEPVTHTDGCSYVEAVEGHECGYVHEHDDDCGYVAATDEIPCDMACTDTDEDGKIDHDPACAYTPATEGSPCTFVHEHDETCGYVEAVEGVKCDCGAITYEESTTTGTDEQPTDDEVIENDLQAKIDALPTIDEIMELDNAQEIFDSLDALLVEVDAYTGEVALDTEKLDVLVALKESMESDKVEELQTKIDALPTIDEIMELDNAQEIFDGLDELVAEVDAYTGEVELDTENLDALVALKAMMSNTALLSADDVVVADDAPTLPTSNATNSMLTIRGGEYKLNANITLIEAQRYVIWENNDVVIDLNGYTITGCRDNDQYKGIFHVYGNLTIIDSSNDKTGTITNGKFDTGGAIRIYNGGSFTLKSGTISGSYASVNGGAVYVETNATFTMDGGTIKDSSAYQKGGAVYAEANATVVMNDGTIQNNRSGWRYGQGNNVYLNTGATFTMNDGSISSTGSTRIWTDPQTTRNGGGIFSNGGIIKMTGGSITGHVCMVGGGVYLLGGTFDFTGGVISGNYAETGGGIEVDAGAVLTIDGGTISGNAANKGAGVLIVNNLESSTTDSAVILKSGFINNNTAVSYSAVQRLDDLCRPAYGAGVCLESEHTAFTMSGGEISKNKLEGNRILTSDDVYTYKFDIYAYGAGIAAEAGTVTMNGGKISDNTTELDVTCGAGVWLTSEKASFTMTNGEISGNIASISGAGVSAFKGATVTLNGGTITGNTAKINGGGVYSDSTVNVGGTKISNNNATYGGGVFIAENGIFNMTAGELSGNNATEQDGYVDFANKYPNDDAGLYMGGGYNYSAMYPSGGGLCTDEADSIVAITGGSITNNDADICGGGIAVLNKDSGVLTLKNVTITGNTAEYSGDGVFTRSKDLQLDDNLNISGNDKYDLHIATPDDTTVTLTTTKAVADKDANVANLWINERTTTDTTQHIKFVVNDTTNTANYEDVQTYTERYFGSNHSGYVIFTDTDDTGNYLYLGTPFYITFQANDGKFVLKGDTTSTDDVVKHTNIHNNVNTFPTVTREGYAFDGWEKVESDENIYNSNYKFTEDTTLKATWVLATYEVQFMTVTSEYDFTYKEYECASVTNGEKITLPSVAPELDGYTFGKWFTVVYNEETKEYEKEFVTSKTVCNSDMIVYATWGKINVDVKVDVNIDVGTGELITDANLIKEMTAIEVFNATQANPSDDFQWYTIDLTGTVVTAELEAPSGKLTVKEDKDVPVYEIVGPHGYLAPIGVLIDFDSTGKENLRVYRYHDETLGSAELKPDADTSAAVTDNSGNVTLFEEVYERQEPTDDAFYNFPIYQPSVATVYFSDTDLVNEDTETHGNVALYSGKFSTYAIGYDIINITFDANGGSVTSEGSNLEEDGTLLELPTPTRSGYTFDGWATSSGDKVTVDTIFKASTTIYAQWSKNSSGDGSSSATYYEIEIEQSGSGTISPDGGSDNELAIKKYNSQTFTFTPDADYQVSDVLIDGISIGAVSSYTFSRVTSDHTLFVVFSKIGEHTNPQTGVDLNRDDHFAYMVGYPDETFGSNRNITRAEATVMFSRLLIETMDTDTTYTSSFWDVSENDWFANAIGYMEQFGIVSGYEDGSFRGDNPITRAEFSAIASRFDELAETDENIFSDVLNTHWAISYINSAAEKGWINGYLDGTFKPDQYITRAEAVTLVNNVLDRSCDVEFAETHLDEIKQFTDIDDSHWAYYQIIEATNSHDYAKENDKETWTKLN